jgi:hypothetical protein
VNRAVWKFPVVAAGGFGSVSMPVASEILHADVQGIDVFVWALVDPRATVTESRRLGFFGTGFAEIPLGARHIGSCIDRGRGLVWHVFEAGS